jgi:hypothetical protein
MSETPRRFAPGRNRGLLNRSGKAKGTPNKIKIDRRVEMQALCYGLFDDTYWINTRKRLRNGQLPPAIEARLLEYAYGAPDQTLHIPELTDLKALLAQKVVIELHPGPSQSRAASVENGTTLLDADST